MKRAICLSGGGARGAYEIGVWKALKKLHLSYQIITGTSVGALNGALMVQDTFLKAYLLWQKMDFSILFKEEDLEELKQQRNTKSLIKMYAKNVLNGGMDVEELENLVKKYLNTKKIKNSSIDFGIITVNTKTLKPKIITKNQIDIEKLCDYLIASASCYPFFQKKKIDGNEFIDGGFYDNLPINLAIDLGATEIIAVDLKAVGRVQPVKKKSIPITYIRPRNPIGNFLVFEKNQARTAIEFGYNDTMKTFGILEGNIFTFRQKELSKNYVKKEALLKQSLRDFFTFKDHNSIGDELLKIAVFKRLIHSKKGDISSLMDETIEFLGITFDLKQNKIYSIESYHRHLKKQLKETESVSKKMIEEKKIPGSKEIIKYFYEHISQSQKNKKLKQELCTLCLVFPKEFLGAMYCTILRSEHGK